MRILLATSSLASHHFAMVPFGWAALAAGHEVRLAASPEIVPVAARSGLPVLPVGPPIDFPALHRDLLRRVGEGTERYDPKTLYAEVADAMADDLVDLARSWKPDAVLWDPATLAAPLAATVVGARTARCLWGIDMLARGETLIDRLPARFPAMFDRFGVRLPDDPQWPTFDPSPRGTWPVTGGQRRSVRYVPYSPNGIVPDWIFAPRERPRVCLTFGAGIAMKEFVADGGFAQSPIFQGVSALDVEIVIAVAQTESLGTLPPSVRVVTGCPLPMLLRGCDAVVHHGGNGTMLTAALYGIPQVVVPYLPDLRFSADRFALTGAVTHLNPTTLSAIEVQNAVGQSLADTTAATTLRDDMREQPLPADILGDFLTTPGSC